MATIYLLGFGCANPKHPRGLAEWTDRAEVIRYVREEWRCTMCGGANAMTGDPLVRERPDPDDDDKPGRVFGL